MTVNHGVLGSSPCSGALSARDAQKRVANDKLRKRGEVGDRNLRISRRRGRASEKMTRLLKNLSESLQIKK